MAILRSSKSGLQRGDVVDLPRLDALLDVPVSVWPRTVKRLVKEMRTRAVSVEIPGSLILSDDLKRKVGWTGVFEAQVKQLPPVERADEFLMARRYEFMKARVSDALAQVGFDAECCEELVGRAFSDLPTPPKARAHAARKYLEVCVRQLEALRNVYVESGLYIVLRLVHKYRGLGVDDIDMVQEGNASLFQAIDGFDWRRDVRFKTYAQYWVHQAILKVLYDSSRTVRLPVWIQKAHRKIQRLRDDERRRTGTEMSSTDVGAHLDMTPSRVDEIASVRRYAVSLDSKIGREDDTTLGQMLPDKSALPVFELVDDSDLGARLTEAMDKLPERERKILERRFGLSGREPETLGEIAEDLGITAERVRQLQNAGLGRLQKPATMDSLRAYA